MISLRDVVTGFGNRDPLAEVWRRDLRGGGGSGGGAAVITGSLPLRYIGNGTPLTDYLISGNTVQNGTPTPEAPVDAVGCGVRTENLFDVNGETYLIAPSIIVDKNEIKFENVPSGNTARIIYSAQYAAGTYYISCVASGSNYSGVRLFSDSSFTGASYNSYYGGYYRDFAMSGFSTSFTFDNDFKIGFIANAAGGATFTIYDIMLSTTEADFEPYGYKLPPTVNGTEYPIYLGQVETTRRIKKLVLTGEENVTMPATSSFQILGVIQWGDINGFCTHYPQITWNEVSYATKNGFAMRASSDGAGRFRICDLSITTVADFKSYLQQQYAAGTPVTVWYVLANPETAVVNEPLMKIGDYADTISFAQAEVVIPTVNDANVLDMTSPVKPSEVYIKGKGIKPTGYGQLVDKNDVRILDKNNVRILVHGQ